MFLVAALFAVTLAASASKADAATTSSSTTKAAASSGYMFSDPVWFPLRRAASVHCVKSDCSLMNGRTRGIDFNAHRGDPVYAAGAGIAHIGAGSKGGCTQKESGNGRWIWIDHGGGIVSRYHHLDKITIKNGQQVTPHTKIGTVGNSGAPKPCTAMYLHFEVHNDGQIGLRVATPALAVCTSSGKKILPNIWGTKSWDNKRVHHKATPTGNSSCLSNSWAKTPARPSPSLKAGASSIKISWGRPPAGTDKILIRMERYSTALHGYGRPYHYTVSGKLSSKTYTGLTNGRAYKVAVSFHNSHGYSAWSAVKTTTPGRTPSASGSPRYLTWPHGKYVHYGWVRSNANGSTVYRYEIAIRCSSGGSYGAWKNHMMGNVKDTYYNFQKLGKAKTCQVRVHGKNKFGWGAWSKAATVRK